MIKLFLKEYLDEMSTVWMTDGLLVMRSVYDLLV